MLRPFFELFRIITIQYSFVYTVQMQKQNKTKNPPKEQTNKQKNRKNTNTVLQKNRYHLLE